MDPEPESELWAPDREIDGLWTERDRAVLNVQIAVAVAAVLLMVVSWWLTHVPKAPEKRVAYFSRRIRKSPDDPGLYWERAQAHADLEDYDSALRDLDAAVRLALEGTDPWETADWYLVRRADIYLHRGEYERALEDYTRAIEIGGTPDEYASRAHCYRQMGEHDKAIADLTQAIRLVADEPYASYTQACYVALRADIYRDQGNYELAVQEYTRALDRGAGRYDWRVARGWCHEMLGQFDKALADYEFAACGQEYLEGYWHLGLLQLKMGRYEEAIENFSTVIQYDPDFAPAYAARAQTRAKLKKYELAILDCDKAIELRDDEPAWWLWRASCWTELGEYERAVRDCYRVIELAPDRAEAFFFRGRALLRLGEFERALADANAAVELDPRYCRGYWLRAQVRAHLGDKAGVWEDVDKCEQLGRPLPASEIEKLKRILAERHEAKPR